MTADVPLCLVPKIRFAEFRDSPGWEELPLSSASDVNPSNDGLPESFIYIDLESVTTGVLVERKEIVRDTAPSRAQRLLRRKDIIFQTVRPYQRNNLFFDFEDEREYVASTGYAQLRAHDCPEFLYQLLHTDSFVNSVLAQCTGSNYPAINSSDLARIYVALPRKPEQQKIAKCLGSLDGVIAAEGRKLKALRQHKQGLMQQIFPQPGETMPRLRFPEFYNAGDWERGLLKDFVKSIRTGKLDANAMVDDGNYRFYTCAKHYYRIDNYAFEGEALLIAGNGAYLGYIHHYVGRFNAYQRTYVLQDFEIDVPFLKAFLDCKLPPRIQMEKKDGNTPYIVLAAIADMPLLVPPSAAEQKRVAACLSSLDEMLAAQLRKVEGLTAHKKALLQQLFPSIGDESR